MAVPADQDFVADDFEAFLDLLPRHLDGMAVRHVVEVRHPSFCTEAFVALLRARGIAVAFADSDKYPAIADVTGDFVYARLQRTREEEPAGYVDADLARWAARFRLWSTGGAPDDLSLCGAAPAGRAAPRPCFVYFISGAKVRAPAAAVRFLAHLETA